MSSIWYRMVTPSGTKQLRDLFMPLKSIETKADPVLMLELAPGYLGPGTFEVDSN